MTRPSQKFDSRIILSSFLGLIACKATDNPTSNLVVDPPAPVQVKTLIDVVLTEGTNMAAAPSPDGSMIVLALQGSLWSIGPEGGEATPITPPELDAHEPIWSPDGTQLAFYAYARDGFSIWTMQPDGSQLTEVTGGASDSRYPSFSPDGASLIYSSDETEGYQVWTVSLETGERQMLTTADETGYAVPLAPYFSGTGNAVYPTLSPDGSMLAFVIDGEKDALVTRPISSVDGFEIRYMADTLGAPVWTPDGDALVIAGISAHEGQIARVPAREGDAELLVSRGDVFPFRPAILPDGSILYTADGHVMKLSNDGSDKSEIPFEATVTLDRTPYERRRYDLAAPSPNATRGIIDPVLSPDGSRVVFTAIGDLWLADTATGAVRQLTDDEFVDLSPNWSPESDRVAFVSDRGGKSDIWILDLVSGDLKLVSDLPMPPNSPAWSPDGMKVAFLEDAFVSIFLAGTVNVLDIETGEKTVLTRPIFGPGAPVWSPDGSAIALSSRIPSSSRFREGINGIMLISATEAGQESYVSPVEGKSLGRRQWSRLAWAPDGDFVYRMDNALWMAHLTSGGEFGYPVKIAESGENPAWSSNGRKLVYLDAGKMHVFDKDAGITTDIDLSLTWTRATSGEKMTVRAGRLFDGSGEVYMENVDIIVESGIISDILPAGTAPVGRIIDASDKTVMPGLIEGHTHQSTSQGNQLGQLWLSFGITTVRETGDDPYHLTERKEAIASGRRQGPRVFAAGPLNEGARVSYGVSETTGTIESAEDAMRRHEGLGLDFFKSYVRQDFTVQNGVVRMAHDIGIPVASHELYPAVANNIDQLEHFGATSRRGFSLIRSENMHSYQDVIALISKSGMVVTPTLALMSRNGMTNIDPVLETLKRVVDGGGRIMAGTDSPFIPHGDALHTELKLYVEAGLTPAKALRTATSESAQIIGVGDQLGKIAPGYIADIIIIDGDPLANISDSRNVNTVIQMGKVTYMRSSD